MPEDGVTKKRPGVGGALMLITTRALEERLVVVVHVRVNARVTPGDREDGKRIKVTPTGVALDAPPLERAPLEDPLKREM